MQSYSDSTYSFSTKELIANPGYVVISIPMRTDTTSVATTPCSVVNLAKISFASMQKSGYSKVDIH